MKKLFGIILIVNAVSLSAFVAQAQPAPAAAPAPSATNTNAAPAPQRPGGGFRNRADQPSPRNDANSKLAHEQLVAKAKQGGIDIYFEGDSITRRWGTKDA